MATKNAKISDLIPDPHNANKGTQRGLKALDASLRQYGAGRSILLDAKGRIIAGNKTAERAADIGMDDVIIVESDGSKVIAVQRTDLDLETDGGKARALATYDNRVGELDLDWDVDALGALDGDVLQDLWTQTEIAENEIEFSTPDPKDTLPGAYRPFVDNGRSKDGVVFFSVRKWILSKKKKDMQYVKDRKYELDDTFASAASEEISRFIMLSFGRGFFTHVTTPPRSHDTEYHLGTDFAKRVASSIGAEFVYMFKAWNRIGRHPMGEHADIEMDGIADSNARFLIVDDVAVSGNTLTAAVNEMRKKYPAACGVCWIYDRIINYGTPGE